VPLADRSRLQPHQHRPDVGSSLPEPLRDQSSSPHLVSQLHSHAEGRWQMQVTDAVLMKTLRIAKADQTMKTFQIQKTVHQNFGKKIPLVSRQRLSMMLHCQLLPKVRWTTVVRHFLPRFVWVLYPSAAPSGQQALCG